MNKVQQNLLLNLYFFKQLIKNDKLDEAKTFIENESGLEIEQLIEENAEINFEQSVIAFTFALAQLKDQDLNVISKQYIELFSKMYYSVIDLKAGFVKTEEVINTLNNLFHFPAFEATLLFYVKEKMLEESSKKVNDTLSTYIHIAHIKYLAITASFENIMSYINKIGFENYITSSWNLEDAEIELLKAIETKENINKELIDYFNAISNEARIQNKDILLDSLEFMQNKLRDNKWVHNIVN